jgi:hypothetical protein
LAPTIALLRCTEHAGEPRQQLRRGHQPARVDAGIDVVEGVAHLQRHHQFLHRGIAGALADAVDGALDLARAALDRGQRVGHGQAEVVVAVRTEDDVLRCPGRSRSGANRPRILVGRGVAHGVGNIDRAGAGLAIAAANTSARKSSSVRVPSSAENSTSSQR